MKVQTGVSTAADSSLTKLKQKCFNCFFLTFTDLTLTKTIQADVKMPKTAANAPCMKMLNANRAWCLVFFPIACHKFPHTCFYFCTCYGGLKAPSWRLWLRAGDQAGLHKNDSRKEVLSFSHFSLFAILKAVYNYVWSWGTDGSLLWAFMKKENTTQEATCSCVIRCLFACRQSLSFIFTFTKNKKKKCFVQGC